MNKPRLNKITILVPTFNSERDIRKCLKSASWADEIFVVDSGSTDRTIQIAKEMEARIVQHEYIYSAKQKNWAIPKAKHNWVFLLDSDEVITPSLRKEILKLLDSKDINKYDGFAIARKHYFLGKWLRWGGRYPLYNIRLFKKKCRYEDCDVHAHIVLPKDKVKKLKGDILHFSDPTLEHFLSKFNRYTTYQANYMLKFANQGQKIEWKKFFTYNIYTKSVIKDYWYFIPMVSIWRFVYMYFIRLGFLDGRYGFLIAILYSFQDYVCKTKYLELRGRRPKLRFFIQKIIKIFILKNNNKIVDRVELVNI